jgi:hypothetical protein
MTTRILLTLLLTLTACAPWTLIDADHRIETKGSDYRLELPTGWVKHSADANDLFLTRDGPALDYIAVNRQPHDRKLPYTRRETSATMLPQELAELTLAEWKNSPATANFELRSNQPATIGGKPGVRLHIRFKNERGLPIERVMYELVDARGRLAFQYEAPAIVYFQRGLADFEAMVASVRFVAH